MIGPDRAGACRPAPLAMHLKAAVHSATGCSNTRLSLVDLDWRLAGEVPINRHVRRVGNLRL